MIIKVKKRDILLLFIILVLPYWIVAGFFVTNTPRENRTGVCVISFMMILLSIYMIVAWILPELRVITMDEEGCTVTWLNLKKTHKWKELKIIREDYWQKGRLRGKGIVFSRSAFRKNGKEYTSSKIVGSLDFLNCFYVGYHPKKGIDGLEEVDRQEFLQQLEAWGVKVEKGKEVQIEERHARVLKLGEEKKRIRKECEKNRRKNE